MRRDELNYSYRQKEINMEGFKMTKIISLSLEKR